MDSSQSSPPILRPLPRRPFQLTSESSNESSHVGTPQHSEVTGASEGADGEGVQRRGVRRGLRGALAPLPPPVSPPLAGRQPLRRSSAGRCCARSKGWFTGRSRRSSATISSSSPTAPDRDGPPAVPVPPPGSPTVSLAMEARPFCTCRSPFQPGLQLHEQSPRSERRSSQPGCDQPPPTPKTAPRPA